MKNASSQLNRIKILLKKIDDQQQLIAQKSHLLKYSRHEFSQYESSSADNLLNELD